MVIDQPISIRNITPGDIPSVLALQQKYERAFPGGQIILSEVYLSPAFHNGLDVFCALDGNQLLAYAPVYLQVAGASPAASNANQC